MAQPNGTLSPAGRVVTSGVGSVASALGFGGLR